MRLEEMDSLFGDASTVMGTPSIHADTESLLRTGSPGPSREVPGMSLDAAAEMDDDNKSQIQTSGGEDRSIGGWLSRIVARGRSPSTGSGQGRYAPLGQQDENRRNDD